MSKPKRAKRFMSSLVTSIMVITMMLSTQFALATEAEKYPFTMFASSSKEGAITVESVDFNINGNVGTNGTIISTGNMNIKGIEYENAGVNMIYILEKLNTSYFSNSNVQGYPNDYSKTEEYRKERK